MKTAFIAIFGLLLLSALAVPSSSGKVIAEEKQGVTSYLYLVGDGETPTSINHGIFNFFLQQNLASRMARGLM